MKDSCPARAAGLAFNSILALVPLSALVFSIVSAIGGLDDMSSSVRAFLLDTLVPSSQGEVLSYFENFIANTKTLGVTGLMIFLVTSLMLIMNIDQNFNDIWKTRKRKNMIEKISTYTAVLILGSLFVAVSFSLSSWIHNQIQAEIFSQFNHLIQILIRFSPWFAMFMALVIMNMFIPHDPVNIRHASLAAIVGATAWEIIKYYFGQWAGWSVRNSIIYGSLALIPMFLFWLNLAWMVVLGQLEIANVMDKRLKGLWKHVHGETTSFDQFVDTVAIMNCVQNYYDTEQKPITLQKINRITQLGQGYILLLLDKLVDLDLVYETTKAGYMTKKDYSLEPVWRAFVGDPKALDDLPGLEEFSKDLKSMIEEHL